MQHLEVSGAVVLYIGHTVSKVNVVCNYMVIPHFSGDELIKIFALYCGKYSITRQIVYHILCCSVLYSLLLQYNLQFFELGEGEVKDSSK
jgi:hypothetical protein